MDELPEELIDLLVSAGWRRDEPKIVEGIFRNLRSTGFEVSDAAVDFLSCYGLLKINHRPTVLLNGSNAFCWTAFDPTVVATARDARIALRCSSIVGRSLCPVGIDGFHLTLYVADDCSFFAGRDASVYRYADSVVGLFRAMKDGVRPAHLADWG
nr:SUKH-3 domain-containing protein [Micromonospora sp. DSM 115978]